MECHDCGFWLHGSHGSPSNVKLAFPGNWRFLIKSWKFLSKNSFIFCGDILPRKQICAQKTCSERIRHRLVLSQGLAAWFFGPNLQPCLHPPENERQKGSPRNHTMPWNPGSIASEPNLHAKWVEKNALIFLAVSHFPIGKQCMILFQWFPLWKVHVFFLGLCHISWTLESFS